MSRTYTRMLQTASGVGEVSHEGNTIATVRYHLWIRPEEHGLIRSSGIVDVITGELMLVADVPLILHLEAGQSIWFVARARPSAIGREQYDITLISDLSGIT